MSYRLGLLFLGACSVAAAAVPAPPTPGVYDVRIRYRIDARRNERVVQYAEMMRFLQAHGFRRDPDAEVPENEAEDVQSTLLVGTVPGPRARELLGARHVKALLLIPKGTVLPEDKEQLVRADLTLASGLTPERQRQLHEQAREVLASLRFREGAGYDNRGYTRLTGMIPVGQLDTLLTDLRKTPAGARQPAPFASAWPLRVTEVMPGVPLPGQRPRPPAVPPGQEKLTADLREVAADAAPRRLEVILAAAPTEEDRVWRRLLSRAVPGLVVEGRVGPLVTVMTPATQAPALAALDEVAAVRLPRVARPASPASESSADAWKPLLEASGLARLHDRNHRGKGIRIAVVDTDFAGWDKMLGKELPAGTRLLDLTLERNRDLQPDPFATKTGIGPGTRRAVTVLRAAPEADLTLIRIDPAAPYMLYQAARAINCDAPRSVSLDNRFADLENDRRDLDLRRERLLEERRLVLEDFNVDDENVKRRQDYRKRQAEFDADERRYYRRVETYFAHQKALRDLKGVHVVASAPAWEEGYPADGGSTLSRYFDERPFRAALWFQAAGDTRGQSWSGLFRDADGNGVLEFVPPGAPLPPGAWTPELNFLGWRAPGQKPAADLPAGARVRVSLQWREAHEGLYLRLGEDPYREPLARLRLVLLYQPDPAGARRPADDLEIVAQSAGLPQRLDQTLNGATYEQTVEVVVAKAGRYAVRVEGRAPEGIVPRGQPTLPGDRKTSELYLRLFVTTLAGNGRAVWADHATEVGALGMPGDARTAITVGAADVSGEHRPDSAAGPPFTLDLLAKPDVWAFDAGQGSAEAAAFAAGMAASLRSAGCGDLSLVTGYPGGLFRVPPDTRRGAR
jgi:hypothetical protein